jgi:hypothetical protein
VLRWLSDAVDNTSTTETKTLVNQDQHSQPPAAQCPDCGAALHYVDSEVSSGAFRPQALSMPQMPIHYYDCPACKTCWKLGTKLLPDPIRQILKS